jgi:acetyltransferase
VRLAEPSKPPRMPLAIKPFPLEWQKDIEIVGLGGLHLRPIRPDDEAIYRTFFDNVSMEDRRLRLFSPIKELSHGFIVRMTQIDYAREIAFVAISVGSGEMLGVVRYIADPDLRSGEFAVLVRSDVKGLGLGWRLMQYLIDYAKAAKLETLMGDVLSTNESMLRMCDEMGFSRATESGEPGVVRVELRFETIQRCH